MLIVLEGLDGAGKSTQLHLLSQFFLDRGQKTQYLHFPRFDAPVYGELIAKFLRGDFGSIEEVHPQIVALLFAEDRRDAAELIRGWLKDGYVVVLDRYVYSNIAFQCSKLRDKEEAKYLRDWIFNTEFGIYSIPRPDLNLFLDVPLSFVGEKLKNTREGDDRAYLSGKKDIHEADLSFQEKVREIYLQQCEIDKSFIRIDCSSSQGEMLSAQEIFSKIQSQIEKIQ